MYIERSDLIVGAFLLLGYLLMNPNNNAAAVDAH